MNVNQTKVIIPSNVADTIEWYRIYASATNEIILDIRSRPDLDEGEILRSIPFDTLLSALVNGYVYKKTEAERHAELFEDYRSYFHGEDENDGDDYNGGFIDGVAHTLAILGINVVGINCVAETTKPEVSANV